MITGVLSYKLRNITHWGVVYHLLPMFYTRKYVCFSNSSFLVTRLNGPSTWDRTYFYWSRAQVFRVGRRCYIISTKIPTCIIVLVLFVCTLCGALALGSVKHQRSIGDASVRYSTLESAIWFVQAVCDCILPY